MEEVARRNDTPLLPERGITLSSAVDANLRDRIRSLLVARNRRHPSRTPCPSPDYNYAPRASEENRPDQYFGCSKIYDCNPTKTVEAPAQRQASYSDMGATRFDGPAGQFDDNDGASTRRPSQPGMSSGGDVPGAWLWPTQVSGLNHRAHGDVLGRDIPTSPSMNRANSYSSKNSTASRIPRFHLRTVPPATDVNKTPKFNPHSEQGNDMAGIAVPKDHGYKRVLPPTKDTSAAFDEDILAIPYHEVLDNSHSHMTAVDALKDAVKPDHRHQSRLSSDAVSSTETVKTGVIKTQLNQLPGTPSKDHVSSSQGIPGHPMVDDPEAPLFVIGDDNDAKSEIRDVSARQDESTIKSPQTGQDPLLSGRKLSKLLADLPPLRQTTEDETINPYTIATPAVGQGLAHPTNRSSLVSSLQSIALNEEERLASPVSPLVPKPLEISMSSEHKGLDESEVPLIEESRRASQATKRLSTVSRAVSILSNLSGRSRGRTLSLNSSVEHKSTELTSVSNLTARTKYRLRNGRDVDRLLANVIPARRGYKPLIDKDQPRSLGPSNDTDATLILRHQERQNSGFNKVISDLESLLKEALDIAGQASSREHSESTPLPSQLPPNRYNRVNSNFSTNSGEYPMRGADEEDNPTSALARQTPPRQALVSFNKPRSKALSHGHFNKARDATPYPAQTTDQFAAPDATSAEPEVKHQVMDRQFLDSPRESSRTPNSVQQPLRHEQLDTADWAAITVPPRLSRLRLEVKPVPPTPKTPPATQAPTKEQQVFLVREHGISEDTLTRDLIRGYVSARQRPPIQPRESSVRLRVKAKEGPMARTEKVDTSNDRDFDDDESDCDCVPYVADFKTSALRYHPVFQDGIADGPWQAPTRAPKQGPFPFQPRQDTLASLRRNQPVMDSAGKDEAPPITNTYSLEGRNHFSIREPRGFSLSRSHRRSPIARDWSNSRKRYTATVVCITTAFMGLIVGIYAGEVPAIQYAIADEHHYTILGNVFFFIGLAITTALFYPLPLLHGRKPYTLAALAILLPLQFPQALAVDANRSPYVATYRVGLLAPRFIAGIVMGFANINFKTTLLDLYGASLQSGNPHQEILNENDVRRHGGGMGVWLSIWTWCAIGSLGLGFLIGADIISGLNVSWGFWILIILNAAVLVLNILTPEVRRSAYRRSMAEVRSGGEVSRRVARGEIKMHLQSTGPVWWWEEVWWGHVLAIRMLKQPGFAILSLYLGWIYGQVVLVIVVSQLFKYCMVISSQKIAAWVSSVEILSLPPTIRWTRCGDYASWRSICNTFPESILVQPFKTSPSKDRQYDLREARYLDISSCQTSNLYDLPSFCRHGLHTWVTWAPHSLHGAHHLRWIDRIPLKSCHC